MIFHQPGLPKIRHYSDASDRTISFKQKWMVPKKHATRTINPTSKQFVLENNPIVAPNCFKQLGAEQGYFSMRVLLVYKHIMLDIQLNDWMPDSLYEELANIDTHPPMSMVAAKSKPQIASRSTKLGMTFSGGP